MDLRSLDFVLAALGALAAGAINALAGGGTLITFPLLTFLGIPAVVANVTNTVALCPGYFGGTLAQMKDLQGQKGTAAHRRRIVDLLDRSAESN